MERRRVRNWIIWPTVTESSCRLKVGRLRALAVTSATRFFQVPELPTMIEAGFPGFVQVSWYGVIAPTGTPAPIVNLLSQTINEGLRSPENQETITRLGAVSNPVSPEDFAAFIATQHHKWLQVAKSSHITVD